MIVKYFKVAMSGKRPPGFKWCVQDETVPITLCQSLQTFPSLEAAKADVQRITKFLGAYHGRVA